MSVIKLSDLLLSATQRLRDANIQTYQLEIQWLAEDILKASSMDVLLPQEKSVSITDQEKFQKAVERRAAGEPLSYILGWKEFYGLRFHVQPGVLIPRPETEFVVEEALRRWPTGENRKILDMGCGSGCIGLTVLKQKPHAELIAIDQSPICVEVSRRNARELEVEKRVQVLQCEVENFKSDEKFAVIVANPPYIAPDDVNVAADVKKFEPHTALFAGYQGLDAIRKWSQKARHLLIPNGIFVVEIGAGQEQVTEEILAEGFRDIQQKNDYAGWVRVISARKKD